MSILLICMLTILIWEHKKKVNPGHKFWLFFPL